MVNLDWQENGHVFGMKHLKSIPITLFIMNFSVQTGHRSPMFILALFIIQMVSNVLIFTGGVQLNEWLI